MTADLLSALDQSLTYAETMVDAVEAGQLGDPTPCVEFSVEALIDHVVSASQFLLRINGVEIDAKEGQSVGALIRERGAALREQWTPEALGQVFDTPFGQVPGAQVVSMCVVEFTGHGLDLAVATGQESRPSPELAEAACQITSMMGAMPRDPKMIGVAVPVPADAPAWARFYGSIGRDPAWTA
jgi:uncharacterized protein (TIGR03086 family)